MADDFATTSDDNIPQTGGTDTLTVTAQNEINPNDFFDGLGGIDTILLGTAGVGVGLDFSGVTTDATHGFHNYEALTFTFTSGGPIQATFSPAQFGTGLISNTLAVTGSAITEQVAILNATNFSAAGWTFTNWGGNDLVLIAGTGGNDTLTGSSERDGLSGGGADDVLAPGLGNDLVDGGLGNDTVSYQGNSAITVDLTIVGPQNTVGAGNDEFTSIENVIGSATGGDTLIGDNNANVLTGLGGDDTLNGGDGSDVLIGGAGNDSLTGGANTDLFDFNLKGESKKGALRDVITDFDAAEDDVIDLSGIDAKTGIAGNQHFKFINAHKFHHIKGELHFVAKIGFVLVEGDTNGDGRADFQIQVDDVTSLAKGDFIL